MKPGIQELIGFKKVRIKSLDEHIKGLYKTGNTLHVGIHNKNLNLGGYFSKSETYFDKNPLYKHIKSNFYAIDNPVNKYVTDDIKNPILRKIVNIYGECDLVRYITSIDSSYYGSQNELNEYIKVCDESYIYLNKLSSILKKLLNPNISTDDKIEIYMDNKDDLNKIEIYKKYEFNEIIKIYNEINTFINNIL